MGQDDSDKRAKYSSSVILRNVQVGVRNGYVNLFLLADYFFFSLDLHMTYGILIIWEVSSIMEALHTLSQCFIAFKQTKT